MYTNYLYCSVSQICSPFYYLSLITKGKGAYTQDATFPLAITPSLLVPHPQLRVHIEDSAFDNFAVAIWKDVINPQRACTSRVTVVVLCVCVSVFCILPSCAVRHPSRGISSYSTENAAN